jgi:hypothetical protein
VAAARQIMPKKIDFIRPARLNKSKYKLPNL